MYLRKEEKNIKLIVHLNKSYTLLIQSVKKLAKSEFSTDLLSQSNYAAPILPKIIITL
jgi:hypothetical protein